MKKRKWTEDQLRKAATTSLSIRSLLAKLGLKEAGGNYQQISKYIKIFNIDISHFRGRAWNKGLSGRKIPRRSLEEILSVGSSYQSHKLKKRLFDAGLKKQKCEICGWAEITQDGRMPLELDHINGDSHDNRLINVRILCPNCHSLQPTHRGRNIKKRGLVVEW